MPIDNSAPVDQAAYTKFMVVSVEPKSDPETGVQYTSKDGTQRKWNVQVVASKPSPYDPARTENGVLAVTVTSAEDPKVTEGELVEFAALTVGVSAPTKTDAGYIRGGRLFWTAAGVRARVHAGKSS